MAVKEAGGVGHCVLPCTIKWLLNSESHMGVNTSLKQVFLSPLTFSSSCTPHRESWCNNICQRHPAGAWKGVTQDDKCRKVQKMHVSGGGAFMCVKTGSIILIMQLLRLGLIGVLHTHAGYTLHQQPARWLVQRPREPLSAELLISVCEYQAGPSRIYSTYTGHVTPLKTPTHAREQFLPRRDA